MKKLFTVGQVCKCCGISRSTILRMEDRGLLSPARVDENTGYRYYDIYNITKILHIQMFLSMGLTYDDAYSYYASSGKSPELLTALESRLALLTRAYEEMKLRMDDKQHLQMEIITLPENVCYQKEFKGASQDDKYRDMYNLFGEAVEKGYRPLISERLFVINNNDLSAKKGENTYICCVPLEPSCADEHTVFYPSCTAFSMLCYGNYQAISKAHAEFDEKIRSLGLKPIGHTRGIGIVSGYTGKEFSQEKYVSRLVVPIEDLDKGKIDRLSRSGLLISSTLQSSQS